MILYSLKVGGIMKHKSRKPQKNNKAQSGQAHLKDAQEVMKYLKSDVSIIPFETTDSTNTQAKLYCGQFKDSGITSPVLFTANHQNGGKGRLGRSFYSPADTGLYMSLLIKADEIESDIVCVTTATAVCVADAIKKLCNITVRIKWVNDIYIDNKKVCGILCEAVTNPDTMKIEYIIIGIGVNVSTDFFPKEIKDIATSLPKNTNKNKLCAYITDNIIEELSHISDRTFIEKYKELSLVLGKEITYTEMDETKVATAIDIDNNGGLVIETENGIKTLSTGEITVRLR